MKPRPHPPAYPHGALEEVLPGLYFVTGTVRMSGLVTFSRAMTVVKEGERLVLVNSVRLDDAGLAALERLGKVTAVIRLAGNHGSDDPFYRERYGAKVWATKESPYMPGFDSKAEPYFEPDERFDASSTLPIAGAMARVIRSSPPEALLVLPHHGGTVIAGDALQNWSAPDAYFSFAGRLMMRVMGFLKPHNVGPGWLNQCKPPAADLRAILELSFENVLPSHGAPVIGGAREKFRPAIEAAAKKRGG